MKRIFTLLFTILVLSNAAFSREVKDLRKKAVEKIDFVGQYLLDRQLKGIDTSFIKVPDQQFTARLFADFSFSSFQIKGVFGEENYLTKLNSPFIFKQGIGLSWRGLTLAFSMDLLRKPKNFFNIGLRSYGRKLAFEVAYKSDKNFYGTQTIGDIVTDMPAESLTHKALTSDFFYIFNGDRFSYPAVFNQNSLQRRSAGSIIAALSMNYFNTKSIDAATLSFGGFTMGIGAGYGYNYVHGNWTFHASVIPTIVLLDSSNITVNGTKLRPSYQFFHFITTGNIALIYNRRQFFSAFRISLHDCGAGNTKLLKINYFRLNGRISVGWRF